jgi:PAP2 superfamily
VKVSLPASRYRRHALVGTLLCLGALVLLTIAVALGVTHALDVSARERFRPGLAWGEHQQRANHVVYWLTPARLVLLLLVGSTVIAAWRRTLWPLVQSTLVVGVTGVLTLLLKVVVDRSDPTGQHRSLGGSYPSGHSATLLVCVATGTMLVSCPTRWWQRVGFLALEALLALAILYVALHWLTDIVGGALVAGLVLGLEAAVVGPDGGPSHRGRPHRLRPLDRVLRGSRRRPLPWGTVISPRCRDGH